MSLGLTFLRHSVHGSAFEDNNSAKGSQRRIGFCLDRAGDLRVIFHALFVQFPPGEAVSCACFRRDTRRSSLTAGHRPATVQLESNNPKGKLGQIVPGSCPEAAEVCTRRSGKASCACPLLQPGKRAHGADGFWFQDPPDS